MIIKKPSKKILKSYEKKKREFIMKQSLLNKISDINVNEENYKQYVIRLIKKSKLGKQLKERYLKTANAIRPNSFTWKDFWDKGKIFKE